MTVTDIEKTVRATMHFAADPEDGGAFSNDDDTLTRQNLEPQTVAIGDARAMSPPASLTREGFTVARNPLSDCRWTDQEWIDSVYIPSCVAMVQKLTGAKAAQPYFGVLVRMASEEQRKEAKASPPAFFVHIDQTTDSAVAFIDGIAKEAGVTYRRAQIYNVWRSISPPPQNIPVAVCDQRTVDRGDFVDGMTVSRTYQGGVPHVTSLHSDRQRWWYFPDLQLDETIVFKGVDPDLSAPPGCLHCAFVHPDPDPAAAPRSSVETRVIVFFD